MPCESTKKKIAKFVFFLLLPIARMDLIIRLGWLPLLLHYRWKPTLLSCHIKYILPVYRSEELLISSYIIQVSAKYIWIGHRFECKGQIVCSAIIKLAAPSRSVANVTLMPPQGHFTHHITKHNVELLAHADSTIRNL